MDTQIGCVVLGSLSAMFIGYSVYELTLAYRSTALKAWSERALPGAAGMFVAGLFVLMIRQVLG